MPRKPSLPPPVLKIERLSDGVDPTLRDDFTQEPIKQPNAGPRLSGLEIADGHKHRDVANKALMLQVLGIMPITDSALLEARAEAKVKASAPKGMIAVKLGDRVGYIKARPWRRV